LSLLVILSLYVRKFCPYWKFCPVSWLILCAELNERGFRTAMTVSCSYLRHNFCSGEFLYQKPKRRPHTPRAYTCVLQGKHRPLFEP